MSSVRWLREFFSYDKATLVHRLCEVERRHNKAVQQNEELRQRVQELEEQIASHDAAEKRPRS